jgi:ribosomal protein S27E
MVLLTCPWCDQEEPVDFQRLTTEFRCEGCGTSTDLAEDPQEDALPLAA